MIPDEFVIVTVPVAGEGELSDQVAGERLVAGQQPVLARQDSDLRAEVTAPFQNVEEAPVATGRLLGTTVTFHRAKNPHAGCFFLNGRQMEFWARQPHFLDRDTRFIGPLESAATLGIMRTFRIYKPAAESAGFLEIEHFGTGFLSQLRRRGDLVQAPD